MSGHDFELRTGDLVPASGIYLVNHAPHRLLQEIALFKSERFPRCSKCDSAVLFLLVHPVPALDYPWNSRSEEHTSELQSHSDLVCRLLLEKKKTPVIRVASVTAIVPLPWALMLARSSPDTP